MIPNILFKLPSDLHHCIRNHTDASLQSRSIFHQIVCNQLPDLVLHLILLCTSRHTTKHTWKNGLGMGRSTWPSCPDDWCAPNCLQSNEASESWSRQPRHQHTQQQHALHQYSLPTCRTHAHLHIINSDKTHLEETTGEDRRPGDIDHFGKGQEPRQRRSEHNHSDQNSQLFECYRLRRDCECWKCHQTLQWLYTKGNTRIRIRSFSKCQHMNHFNILQTTSFCCLLFT